MYYMVISGIGLVLLFVSNEAIIFVNEPYPPFGFVSVLYQGLASYLVLIGIYSSAISISEDSRLRSSIRDLAMKETTLLDSIGTAQMEQQIQRRVIAFTKQNQDKLVEETGIQSTVTEEEMRQYVDQVIEEVRRNKATSNKTNSGNI